MGGDSDTMSIFTKVEDFLVGEQNRGLLLKSTEQALIAVPIGKVTEVPGLVSKGIVAGKGLISAGVAKFSSLSLGGKTAVVVGGGVVAKSSTAQQSIANLPKTYDTFTTNVANTIDNPTIANFSQIAKDNPVVSGLAVGGLVIGAGKGAGALASLLNTSAIKSQTEVLKNAGSGLVASIPDVITSKTNTLPEVSPNNTYSVPAEQSYNANNTGVGYTNTDKLPSTRKYSKRKSQNLNTRPINIRNNIMIANKNG